MVEIIRLGKRLDDGVIKRAAKLAELQKKQEISKFGDGAISEKEAKRMQKDINDQVHLISHAWLVVEGDYNRITKDGEFEYDDV